MLFWASSQNQCPWPVPFLPQNGRALVPLARALFQKFTKWSLKPVQLLFRMLDMRRK